MATFVMPVMVTGLLRMLRIQRHEVDGMKDGAFRAVRVEKLVHSELEAPHRPRMVMEKQNATSARKNGDRSKVRLKEQNHGDANRRAQEAVQRVLPKRNDDVERMDLD